MLHNLPPLPPIKGGDGEETKFPRAASASKYIQATHEEGYEENVIPGQIDDNEGKVKKEVQFKTRGELAADDLQNADRHQNGSTSSLTSIPSKPSRGGMCCCRPKGQSDKRDQDEEKITVGSADNGQREDLEISDSTADLREASATSR